MDSLDLSLNASEQHLDLDMGVIEERILELGMQRKDIQRLHKDTFSYELAQKMGKQRSLLKVYGRSISNKEVFTEELDQLRKQVADLRSDLNKDLMEKEAFKEHYRRERKDVEQLEWNTNALRRDLYEMEPIYQRLAPELDLVLEGLFERDSL